jgi:hypothetical protein
MRGFRKEETNLLRLDDTAGQLQTLQMLARTHSHSMYVVFPVVFHAFPVNDSRLCERELRTYAMASTTLALGGFPSSSLAWRGGLVKA